MKILVGLLSCLLLCGCATMHANLFKENPGIVSQAQKLSNLYLEGQKNGETYKQAAPKYGRGVAEFYGLKDYRYEEISQNSMVPTLRYRIQATNQMGGVLWKTYEIWFNYDEQNTNSEYGGLSIRGVVESIY